MNSGKKRAAAVLLAAGMVLPVFACSHGGNSKEDEFNSQVTVDDNGVNAGLFFNDDPVEAQDKEPTEVIPGLPAVTTVRGDDGKDYVVQTDINGTTVTESGGDPVTELYTGTTVAASYAEESYKPSYRSYLAFWMDTSKRENFVFNGELLEYEIEISPDAKDGIYPFTITLADVSDYDGNASYPNHAMPMTCNVGYICINAEEPDAPTEDTGNITFTPEILSAKPGETVKYHMQIANNTGLVALRLSLGYDSNIFKVVSAKAGKDFADGAGITTNDYSEAASN